MQIKHQPGRFQRRRPVIGGLLLVTLALFLSGARTAAQSDGKQAVVTVQGMQCPFCAYGIKKHLKKLPGAEKVAVELATNQATVTFASDAKVTDADIQQAVRNAGFTPGKIEWHSGGQSEGATRGEAPKKTAPTGTGRGAPGGTEDQLGLTT